MASIHALAAHLLPNLVESGANSSDPRLAAARDAGVFRAAAQDTFYIEDGWVFREHHGKYIECICRTEEIPAATTHDMPEFQLR